MKLQDALSESISATKHVAGAYSGTYSVCKANFSSGYYKDFQPDDRALRSPVDTSTYWNSLDGIASFAGEDGWEPDPHKTRR